MSTAATEPQSVSAQGNAEDNVDLPQQIRLAESRNLMVLALHHVMLRVAWIFKTESVIMPAFMDYIAGAGWLRGFLPTLNRVGQSVPPLYLAEPLRRAPRKKWTLLWTTLGMAIPFLGLAGLLAALGGKSTPWLPYAFLLLYTFFFAMTGFNQLSFGTTQGKLVRVERRGRLLAISGIVGSVASIGCAWVLMRSWLQRPDGGFMRIFAFTGAGFVVAGLVVLLLREPPVVAGQRNQTRTQFGMAMALLRADANLRRLCFVAVFFVTAQLLFPHYQALGRSQADWQDTDLMIWVIAQNAGAGLFSLIAGVIADRMGNRLTIRLLVFGAALTPLISLWLANVSSSFFWLTFIVLGTVPTTFKTLVNYCLEITDESHHPQYISTMKLSLAVPFVLSPVVGLLVDSVGFPVVFVAIAVVTAVGGVLTFFMAEPRHLPAAQITEDYPEE